MNNDKTHQSLPTAPLPPLFLGLDLSTQQLKVIALAAHRQKQDGPVTLSNHSSFAVHFDHDLPHFQTRGGVSNQSEEAIDNGVVTTPVLMWVEALEAVLDKMRVSGFPFERVQAISGAAQQHGSVYWSNKAKGAFESLRRDDEDRQGLTDIFRDAFTVDQSPIWQDTSTTEQCREIEEFLGATELEQKPANSRDDIRLLGQQALADLTGSRAYERYTASQILKVRQTSPDVYDATVRISLVSSFVASLLLGKFASIDVADGSGMNLLDVETKTWDPRLTGFVAKGGKLDTAAIDEYPDDKSGANSLIEKLGSLDASGRAIQGILCHWFVKRYGFKSDVSIVTFTGDNPATVMAMKAEPGDAIVSLGTSDTLLLYTDNHGTGPLSTNMDPVSALTAAEARLSVGYLCHPVDPKGFLMLYCAKNGSLARERVRDQYAEGDWETFNWHLTKAMNSQQPDKNQLNNIGFYFFDREIWPPVKGVYRFHDGKPVDEFHSDPKDDLSGAADNGRKEDQRRANILSICESQFLAMRGRSSQELSSPSSSPYSTTKVSPSSSLAPRGILRILATGGASLNAMILQLLANVFGVPVISSSNSGAGTADNNKNQEGAGSAAWGAARKAYLFGDHGDGNGGGSSGSVEYQDRDGFTYVSNSTATVIFQPDLEQTQRYVTLLPRFMQLERSLLFEAKST